MSIRRKDLLDSYGVALETGNAALFVGGGLSQEAGYPQWSELLSTPRAEAKIPEELADLPLVAEYYVRAVPGGRARLESHVLQQIDAVDAGPGPGHDHIAALPLREVWTTNYDSLLEDTMPSAGVLTRDSDLKDRRSSWERRIIKMHGSVTQSRPRGWQAPPVITRGDYERYETAHPRLWAALTAKFLTQSFLFLGFSFSDPNVEVLLRLARTRLDLGAPEHYTILRPPDEPVEQKLHEHRARDLEDSGIAVYEIGDYAELEPLLGELVCRTRPPRLFVSGSRPKENEFDSFCQTVGSRLSDVTRVELASLAGDAAMEVSYSFGRSLRAQGKYQGERVRLYFRRKNERPPALRERIGTVFYTDQDMEALRETVLRDCRATLVIGGGAKTAQELELADHIGVPIVPLAASGGTAKVVWESMAARVHSLRYGGAPVNGKEFQLLADEDAQIASGAAVRLVTKAMFLS